MDAPPPDPPPSPSQDVILSDLPEELLTLIFTHVFASAAGIPLDAVPYPSPSTVDEELPTGVLVTARGWAAAAGAAGSCRALRAAFLDSVVTLEVHLMSGDRLSADASPTAVGHGVALALLLGRLPALRVLTLYLDGMVERWARRSMCELLFGVLGQGFPPLLCLVVWADQPEFSLVSGMLYGQPALRHLVVQSYQPTEDADVEEECAVALYRRLAPRLQSLELGDFDDLLDRGSEENFWPVFLERLPVFPMAGYVSLGNGPGTGSEAVFATLARLCPALEALNVGCIDPGLKTADGAATLLRHFPALRQLDLSMDARLVPWCGVTSAFVGGLCRGRALHLLCLPSVLDGGEEQEPTALHKALTASATPPAQLRLDGLLTASAVAGLVGDGLPGLLALHLSAVESLSVAACLSLSRLVELRTLYLGSFGTARVVVTMAAASVLAPPALQRLSLHRMDLGVAGATGVVTAFSLVTPQTLHDLVLHDCAGEVEGALAAAAGVRTLRRLVMAEHVEIGSRHAALVSIAEDCRGSVTLLATRRPDLVFAEEL